jgi:hypothetical protein
MADIADLVLRYLFYMTLPIADNTMIKKNTGPVLLIAAGVLLLLSNLNILPLGEIKALVRQWWPLLLIIVGIIQLRSSR